MVVLIDGFVDFLTFRTFYSFGFAYYFPLASVWDPQMKMIFFVTVLWSAWLFLFWAD